MNSCHAFYGAWVGLNICVWNVESDSTVWNPFAFHISPTGRYLAGMGVVAKERKGNPSYYNIPKLPSRILSLRAFIPLSDLANFGSGCSQTYLNSTPRNRFGYITYGNFLLVVSSLQADTAGRKIVHKTGDPSTFDDRDNQQTSHGVERNGRERGRY